ncbi:MAG TPA: hypothetical protein VEL51_22085 [Vicinamibacterales bacterium]|nr:hypothetical protein [Vicinamibacterales bacterium]
MRRFGEWIDHQPSARIRQRGIGLVSQTISQRRQDGDAYGADRFALGGPPFVIAIAIWQVQTVEKLAAEPISTPPEHVGWGARETRTYICAKRDQIHLCVRRIERRAFAVRHQSRDAIFVEERTDLRQTPAKGGTRIVRSLPQQLAEVRAGMPLVGRDEVRE